MMTEESLGNVQERPSATSTSLLGVAAIINDHKNQSKNRLHMAVETTMYTDAAGSNGILVCWQGVKQWQDGNPAALFYSAESEHMGNMHIKDQVCCPIELGSYLRTVNAEGCELAWVELSELAASMEQGNANSGASRNGSLSVITGNGARVLSYSQNKQQLANYYQVCTRESHSAVSFVSQR
jgi:hypothetical protein